SRDFRAIEQVARIHGAVSQKFVERAVPFVGSGARDSIDGAAIAAELRTVIAGLRGEFGDGFHSQRRAQHRRSRAAKPCTSTLSSRYAGPSGRDPATEKLAWRP